MEKARLENSIDSIWLKLETNDPEYTFRKEFLPLRLRTPLLPPVTDEGEAEAEEGAEDEVNGNNDNNNEGEDQDENSNENE